MDRAGFLALRDLVLAVPLAPNVAAYAVRLCGGQSGQMMRGPISM